MSKSNARDKAALPTAGDPPASDAPDADAPTSAGQAPAAPVPASSGPPPAGPAAAAPPAAPGQARAATAAKAAAGKAPAGTPATKPPGGGSRAARQAEQQRRQREQRRRRQQRLAAIGAIAAVVVIIAVLVLVKVGSGGPTKPNSPGQVATPVDPSILATLSNVPVPTMAEAAKSTTGNGPTPVSGPRLTASGTPEVFYLGAEFCPYCAATRWPMVMALLKFGSFSGLTETHSSSTDIDPNTATFSFHGATYTSSYLSFAGVETTTNQPQGSGYAPLDTPTQAEQQLLATYDSGGSIPFIDFANQAVLVGAAYNPAVLAGLDVSQIAQMIANPSTQIAKNVDSAAGRFMAQLCKLTGNQPAGVCSAFSS